MRTIAHGGMAAGVAIAALAIAAVPGAGASVRFTGRAASIRVTGSGIGGFTSQDLPIVVKLSRDGSKVVRTAVALELKCDSGDGFWIPDDYRNLRISRSGRFSRSFVLPPTPNGGGETIAVTSAVSGRANAARTIVTGTWRMTATFHDISSGTDDVCRSGKVSFKVSR